MAIQRFRLAVIQQIRKYIQTSNKIDVDDQLQTWAGLEEVDSVPEPTSLDDLSGIFTFGGLSPEEMTVPRAKPHWALSTVNPGAALLKLPGLHLNPLWRLVAYLYREGASSAGLVLAVPIDRATTAQLEAALADSQGLKQPPQPNGALCDFMEAIQGDRSAASFMVASLFCRELREFGTAGRYRNWTHHRLIDAIPPQVKWQWQTEQPKVLTPKVQLLPDGRAIVEFFTCRVSAGVAIYRHLDQYSAGHYKPKRIDKPLATIQR